MQQTKETRTHFAFHVEIDNAHAVLPRLLLVFSRRRLRIETMHFSDPLGNRPRAHLEVGLTCSERQARDVTGQLDKIFEVHQCFAEPMPQAARRSPQVPSSPSRPSANGTAVAAMLA